MFLQNYSVLFKKLTWHPLYLTNGCNPIHSPCWVHLGVRAKLWGATVDETNVFSDPKGSLASKAKQATDKQTSKIFHGTRSATEEIKMVMPCEWLGGGQGKTTSRGAARGDLKGSSFEELG